MEHEKRLTDATCADFAAALAAKESVPGGGAAAAYAGVLGAALASMVANFTVGKKKYAAYDADVRRVLARADDLRIRLVELVETDARNFYPLSQAYGMSKEDPSRADVLEQCTKDALRAPYDMMKVICEALDLLEELHEKGSRMLLSDVGCGAALCGAALESAALNVLVNTRSLNDKEYARAIEADCDALLADYGARARALTAKVFADVRA